MTGARFQRGRTGLIAALLAFAAVMAAPTLEAQRVQDPRRDTMAKLGRPLSVEFTDARLEDVIEFLETVSQVDIEPMWIDDQYTDGLDPEETLSISAQNVAMLSVLERVLDKAQSEFEGNTWQLSETGAVEVGPKTRLNRSKTLKIYDIQDMLFRVNNYANVPELDLDAAIQQGGSGGGGGGGGSIFEDSEEEEEFQPSQEDQAQQIIDLILEFVEPEQWRDNGGDGGSITFYRGTLLVRAPDYMHRQLGGYSFWPRSLARSASARADSYARAVARAKRALNEQAAQNRSKRQQEDERDEESETPASPE